MTHRPTIDERLLAIIDELQRGGITLLEAVKAFDAKYVRQALKKCDGNITEASRKLGVHRNTLHIRIAANEELRVKPKNRVYGRRARPDKSRL